MNAETVILFPTNAHVMRAETLLKEAGFACKLIPVPRHLSSDCGICLKINQQSTDDIRSLLNDSKLAFDDIVCPAT